MQITRLLSDLYFLFRIDMAILNTFVSHTVNPFPNGSVSTSDQTSVRYILICLRIKVMLHFKYLLCEHHRSHIVFSSLFKNDATSL